MGKQLWLVSVFLCIWVNASGQNFELLHTFNGTDGALPLSAPVQTSDGCLYGATYIGGLNSCGTFYKIDTNGSFTTLVSFAITNGANPHASFNQGPDGNFYGGTAGGGLGGGYGTVYRMTPGGALTSLFSFDNATVPSDGNSPIGELTLADDGNFYGTTERGGIGNGGTVYRLTQSGLVTTLVSLGGTNGGQDCCSTLVQGDDGALYGTTEDGGTNGKGTIFKVTTNGVLTTLLTFSGTNGSAPFGGLIKGPSGELFGTTRGGGPNAGFNFGGTIYKISTNGTLSVLYSLTPDTGYEPYAPLVRGRDGNLYGTCFRGGTYGFGTIFKITETGLLTTMFSLNTNTGVYPNAGLKVGRDGNLYGASTGSGYGSGTLFRIVFPSLTATQIGNQIVVSWPTNFSGYVLQTCDNLNATPLWANWSNSPAVLNGQYVITNALSANSSFFRLKK